MTKENLYLAYYQAIIDRNITKLNEDLTDEQEENYPDEYPELNYNEIFQDSDPDEFIISLLRSEEYKDLFHEFECEIEGAENIAIRDANIAIRDANIAELNNYPLINYSPNPNFSFSTIDSLLSVTYSKIISKEKVVNELSKIVKIFQPLANYWEEVISPAVIEYLGEYEVSNVCASQKVLKYNFDFEI